MKKGYIHICFIIDESSSMAGSEKDVCGGFKKVLDEQKASTDGSCSISLYKFATKAQELYVGKDIHEVSELKSCQNYIAELQNITYVPADTYRPCGCTAMFDGIGMAIDNIGAWLSGMPEEERPEKNLIVIMTDGEENCSTKYSASKVKEMIKHQEDVYSWTFIYMGTDITTNSYADSIGLANQVYTTRGDLSNNYEIISKSATDFRANGTVAFNSSLSEDILSANTVYFAKTGLDLGKDNLKL